LALAKGFWQKALLYEKSNDWLKVVSFGQQQKYAAVFSYLLMMFIL